MKYLFLTLFCSFSIILTHAQSYTASGYVGPNAPVNGVFTNTNMQSDGVDYYQHTTNMVFLFRVDLSGSKAWVIADSPSLSALIIYDVNTSPASNVPPEAGWAAGFLVSSVLPVELIDFTVTFYKNYPQLRWSTASELNNKGFEIESSKDGQHFEFLSFVSGKGNSEERNNYEFMDSSIPWTTTYYRLKQIDFDGQYAYSEIISLLVENTNRSAFLFPNPTRQNLRVVSKEGDHYEIWDMYGRLLESSPIPTASIDVSSLENGTYFIRIMQGNRLIKVLPLIKE